MRKIARSVSVLLLTVLAFLPCESAFAASVMVAIKQLNPNSATQQTTCALAQKNCVLPLTINAGLPTAQSLNVQVKYIAGRLILMFQTSNGYYYVGDTGSTKGFYNVMWGRPVNGSQPATYNITLAQPLTQYYLPTPPAVNVAHPSVANLQITATPGP